MKDTLYKYLNRARMISFFNDPGVSFSSTALFEDKREGLCTSNPPNNQPEVMLRQMYGQSRYGVLCLCGNSTSMQMWDKYAENGQGIMVGLNSTHPFFCQDPFEDCWNKIVYDDKLPVIPNPSFDVLFEKANDSDYEATVIDVLRRAILRKDEKWAFEDERRKRAVLRKPTTWDHYSFPVGDIPDIIQAIYLGANICEHGLINCQRFATKHGTPLFQANISDGFVVFETIPVK